MGTWGSGNFQNDTAGDYFLTFIDRMITILGQQRFHCLCLDIDEIKRWKQIYMDGWTSTIDSCHPDEDYRKEREKILNDTFDKLIAYAEKE